MKHMMHTRLEGLEISKQTWIHSFPSVLTKHNNTVHSTTRLPPNEA